jgi:hypothetical protein
MSALTALPSIAEPLLAPARLALQVAIRRLKAAQAAFAAADQPVQRLNAVVARAQQAETALAEVRAKSGQQKLIADWIETGCVGERPVADHAEQAAKAAAANLQIEAAAAAERLPAAIERRRDPAAAMAAASGHHREMIAEAAVQAAREVVDGELVPAIEAVLWIEARLEGLRNALVSDTTLPNRGSCAGRIQNLIADGKREPSARRDDEAGRDFLNRLGADPAARL